MFEALAGGHYLAVLAAAACGLAGAAMFRLLRARRRVAQMATALDNMSQGLCMFDAGQRLVLCNRSYLKMYDLSPDVVKPAARCANCCTTASSAAPSPRIRSNTSPT
jgi:PAS domain-containing protein